MTRQDAESNLICAEGTKAAVFQALNRDTLVFPFRRMPNVSIAACEAIEQLAKWMLPSSHRLRPRGRVGMKRSSGAGYVSYPSKQHPRMSRVLQLIIIACFARHSCRSPRLCFTEWNLAYDIPNEFSS